MAKSNTWQRKLIYKGKVHALKLKLGGEKSVLARGGATKSTLSALMLDECRATLIHGKMGLPDGDVPDRAAPAKPKTAVKKPLPRVEGHKFKPFGKRGLSGCMLRA